MPANHHEERRRKKVALGIVKQRISLKNGITRRVSLHPKRESTSSAPTDSNHLADENTYEYVLSKLFPNGIKLKK